MIDNRRQSLTYALSDWLALNVGWMLFTAVRYLSLPRIAKSLPGFLDHLALQPVWCGQILFPIAIIALYWLSGYYNRPYFKSRLDDIGNTLWVSAVSAVLIYFTVIVNDGIPERMDNIEMVLLLCLLLFFPVYICRAVITGRALGRIRRGEIYYNSLIVGTGRSAIELAEKINNNRRNGFRIAGLVEVSPKADAVYDTDLTVTRLEDIEETIVREHIERIIVVPHRNGMRETTRLVNSLMPLDCTIFVTPDVYSLIFMRPRIEDVIGDPLIDISSPGFPPMTENCKRTADVIVSAVMLVILSPLYLAIAAAVKLGGKGPVLYRQERVGYRKKPFNILKFRSMCVDSEADGPALSTLDDPRITRVGHVLRKYRLDELPQFWNVLVGDMSLVGPRPERDYYIRQIVERAPYYTLVHRVRPGITSWGMVKYGYASNVDQMLERLRYDLIYLENVSMGVDLKILFHTVSTVLTGKGM